MIVSTLVMFIFYGSKMSTLVLTMPTHDRCEQVFADLQDGLKFTGVTFGRVAHRCLDDVKRGGGSE